MPLLTIDNNSNNLLHKDITDKILKVFYHVYQELGFGFLEKIYQNAMYMELLESGFKCEAQKLIKVWYGGKVMGEYYADMVVNDVVILELKASSTLLAEHEAQLLNYLRSTEAEVGLLLNFGLKPEVRRKIFTNDRKNLRAAHRQHK